MSERTCGWVIGIFMALVIGVAAIHDLTDGRERPHQKAERVGYEDGMLGVPPEACPHSQAWHGDDLRQRWLAGWRRAFAEKKAKEKKGE